MSITGQTPDGKKRQVDTEFAVKHPDNQVAEWQKPRIVPTRKGDQMRQETSEEYWERMETRPDLEGQKGEPWPTPQEHDKTTGNADRVGRFGTAAGGRNLTDEVVHPANWSTPRASDGPNGGPNMRDSSGSVALPGQVLTGDNWTTPNVSDNKAVGNTERLLSETDSTSVQRLRNEVDNWSTPRTIIGDYTRDGGAKGKERLSLDGEAKSWATPTTSDSNGPGAHGDGGLDLSPQVEAHKHWATPIDSDYKGSVTLEHAESRALVSSLGTRLPEQVTLVEGRNWPTPLEGDSKDRGGMFNPVMQRRLESGKQIDLATLIKDKPFQRLNPNWEELLMSWPVGWTDPTQPCAGIFPGFPAGQGPFQYDYEPPRTIHRDDCPNRTKRVSAIGNGVVTLCAAEAFYLLLTEPIR